MWRVQNVNSSIGRLLPQSVSEDSRLTINVGDRTRHGPAASFFVFCFFFNSGFRLPLTVCRGVCE